MSQFILVHANIYSHRRAARIALGLNADVLGYNEASGAVPFLAGRKGYRLHTAQKVMVPRISTPKRGDMRNVSQDTATLVSKKFEYLGEWQQQVSQQHDPAAKVAPDRWFNGSAFLVGKTPVFHLNIHPNWTPKGERQDKTIDNPIVREYEESMKWMGRVLALYKAMGFTRIVSGDFNIPDMKQDPPWSPYRVFDDQGMTWETQHIDGVAWDKGVKMDRWRVIPKKVIKSDHPAIRVLLDV